MMLLFIVYRGPTQSYLTVVGDISAVITVAWTLAAIQAHLSGLITADGPLSVHVSEINLCDGSACGNAHVWLEIYVHYNDLKAPNISSPFVLLRL